MRNNVTITERDTCATWEDMIMSQDAEGQIRTHLKTNRNNMTNMMTVKFF